MTYIERLNSFNLWLECNALEPVPQLLYFKLLNVFNRAGWPESVQVDNQRIMSMTGQHSEKSAIAARDKLVSAGLISYKRGKKNSPGRYSLTDFPCKNYSGKNTVENIHCISGQFPVSYPGGNPGGNPAPGRQTYKDKDQDQDEEQDFLSSSSFPNPNPKTTTTPTTEEVAATDLSSASSALGWKEVMREFSDFLPGASEETRRRLTGYYHALGGEVCLLAIQTARNAAPIAKNKLAYLFGILRNREADGIRSREAWDAHERERSRRSRDAPAQGGGSGRQKSEEELYAELQKELFGYDA